MKMVHFYIFIIFLISGCGGSGGGNNTGGDQVSRDTVTSSTFKAELLKIVNDHRRKIGVRPIQMAKPLEEEIQAHTNKMADRLLPLGHTGMGLRCSRAQREMGGGNLCGEIVAQSYEDATPRSVFNQWYNSIGHRRKMEEPRYNKVGVGISFSSDNEIYSGMLFSEF